MGPWIKAEFSFRDGNGALIGKKETSSVSQIRRGHPTSQRRQGDDGAATRVTSGPTRSAGCPLTGPFCVHPTRKPQGLLGRDGVGRGAQ